MADISGAPGPLISICFWFNAQRHQLLHGIATAAALSRHRGFEVTIASASPGHIDYARQLAARLGGEKLHYHVPVSPLLDATWHRLGGAVPPKLLTLSVAAPWLNRFDAIAIPERTSLILKRMGVSHPAFIHLDHGAGDRAVGFDRRIRQFDFVLMAGTKHRGRLGREGLIREGDHAVVGYPKFEAADAARDPDWTPFPGDDRPIVLYNPHFAKLGSWEPLGEAVLRAFAGQDRYNLIVAPHVRLLDGKAARARWQPLLDRYADHPRIYVDPGSDRSIDMSYTALADVYLGDVSSQVYEYLREPRPCLFLNPHRVDWQEDENYGHWRFGPVIVDTGLLIEAVDAARESHAAYRPLQKAGVAETFAEGDEPPSERAAAAIAGWMKARQAAPVPRPGLARRIARPAMVAAPLLLAGWLIARRRKK